MARMSVVDEDPLQCCLLWIAADGRNSIAEAVLAQIRLDGNQQTPIDVRSHF